MLLVKDEITLEKLKKVNLFIICGARERFTSKEIEDIDTYVKEGGSVLIMQGESSQSK